MFMPAYVKWFVKSLHMLMDIRQTCHASACLSGFRSKRESQPYVLKQTVECRGLKCRWDGARHHMEVCVSRENKHFVHSLTSDKT